MVFMFLMISQWTTFICLPLHKKVGPGEGLGGPVGFSDQISGWVMVHLSTKLHFCIFVNKEL
jgi:hypothetical protein